LMTLGALATASASTATGSSGVEPYLDRLREKISEKSEPPPGSYIDKVRKDLEEENRLNTGDASDPELYLRRLRQKAEEKAGTPPPSYTDGVRSRDPSEDDRHAEPGKTLQSYQDGKHPEARKKGAIHHAVGLRYGASLIRNITVAPAAAAS